MTQAKLLVVGGGETEQEEFALVLPATIGRGKENEITLPHPLVSREHCRILETEGGLAVRDLGSLNGTYVGSRRIEGDHALCSGDLLTIGIVTFRIVLPDSDSDSADLRLESVFTDDTAAIASVDTRSVGVRPPKWKGTSTGETETLRDDQPCGEVSSAAPRKAK